MPIRHQSFIKDNDKNENKILSDIVTVATTRGKLAFSSNDANYFMAEYPLTDQNTEKEFGLITALYKVRDGGLLFYDCDLTIGMKPQEIHLIQRLPASGEANEHYLAEATEYHTPPFVIETVNRHAIWDKELEGKNVKAGLSAFAFRIVVHDNIEDFNKQFDFFPIETERGKVTGFNDDFSAPKDQESNAPYSYFLGKVRDVRDVKVKLSKYALDFSIIYVDCFLGTMPVVASKNKFDLSKLEKGKLVEVSADIKADFGVNPTPDAVIENQLKKISNNKASERHKDSQKKQPVFKRLFKKK